MELKTLLSGKRSVILEKWFNLILESYPPDASGFLRSQRNQFTNPVGNTILKGTEGLFDKLLGEMDSDSEEAVSLFLDNIIRIKAIQDFTPSQAISFIFDLKKVIREELKNENSGVESRISGELLKLESRIDELALESFDIYMKCREKIYDLRAKEFQDKTFRLLQMANLISDPELRSEEDHGLVLKGKDNNLKPEK